MRLSSIFEELHWVLITFFIYIIFVVHHNYKLDAYNKQIQGKTALEVMLYEEGASWKYLAFSFILIIVGCTLVFYYWKYRRYIYENINMILLLLCIFLIVISFIFTITYINNPILQAAMVVVIGGGFILGAMSDSF
ncbi:hypothetical protein J5583_00375 [Streptococcus suis]|uniref:hypothetical protein n=1 Tax=Streptococcus suis TaxID=1307 RepID=UPI001ABED566|nr:hypothetical protein [Streptococcus suis]MBO4108646.1 hypothetical protein [Streptococcus suis]